DPPEWRARDSSRRACVLRQPERSSLLLHSGDVAGRENHPATLGAARIRWEKRARDPPEAARVAEGTLWEVPCTASPSAPPSLCSPPTPPPRRRPRSPTFAVPSTGSSPRRTTTAAGATA